MNLEKIKLKTEGYFSASDRKNVNRFLDVCPVELNEEIVAKVKVYPQDIYHNGELINTLPFYVIALIPEESFREARIDLSKQGKRVKIKKSISLYPDRYEFGMASFPFTGDFYIRLYKVPSKADLSPPKYFQKEIRERGNDMI